MWEYMQMLMKLVRNCFKVKHLRVIVGFLLCMSTTITRQWYFFCCDIGTGSCYPLVICNGPQVANNHTMKMPSHLHFNVIVNLLKCALYGVKGGYCELLCYSVNVRVFSQCGCLSSMSHHSNHIYTCIQLSKVQFIIINLRRLMLLN